MNPGSLILIHGGALGDFVLTLHLLEGLLDKLSCPARVLFRRSYHCLLENAPETEALDLDSPGVSRLFGDQADTALRDVALGLPTSPVVIDCLGTKLSPIHGAESQLFRLDPRQNGTKNHILRQWTDQLAAQGLSIALAAPNWLLQSHSAKDKSGRVLVHPGSGGSGKCWPLERVVEFCIRLTEGGWSVSTALGPAELESWPADHHRKLDSLGTLHRCDRLDQFVDLVQSVQFFVGNDSGPAHLAAALGCQTLVIFQATDPNIWAPPAAHVVGAATDETPPTVDAVFSAWQAMTGTCQSRST